MFQLNQAFYEKLNKINFLVSMKIVAFNTSCAHHILSYHFISMVHAIGNV